MRIFSISLLFLLSFQSFAKTCTYSFDKSSAKLTWTGYKFTSKFAVNGTFDNIVWNSVDSASSLEDLFNSVKFTIDTASINTGVPYRDAKLAMFVFGNIKNPGEITGEVASFNKKQNKSELLLKINGVTQKIAFQAKEKPQKSIVFTSKTDLLDFKMSKSFNYIISACKDLHTGPDGKSKSWSEVGLQVSVQYVETCK